MEWFGFALLAAIVWSLVEVMDKFIVDNEVGDSVLDASVCGIANFGLLFPVSVFFLSSLELAGVLVGQFPACCTSALCSSTTRV